MARAPTRSSLPSAKRLWLLGENGAPGRIRTSGPQIRSLVLYPAELRARSAALWAPARAAT